MEASNLTLVFNTDGRIAQHMADITSQHTRALTSNADEGTALLLTEQSTRGTADSWDMRNIIVGITGATINLFGLVFLGFSRKVKPCLKMSLINLTTTDLLMMIIIGVLGILNFNMKSQDPLCWWSLIVIFTTLMVSYETTCFLAIQNFIAVFYPHRCNIIMTNLRSAMGVGFIWIFGFCVSVLSMGVNPIKDKSCYPVGLISTTGIVSFSVLCIVCTVIVAAINLMIFLKVRRVRRVVHGIPAERSFGVKAKKLSIPNHQETHLKSEHLASTSKMESDIINRSGFASTRRHSIKTDDKRSNYYTRSAIRAVASHLSLYRRVRSAGEIQSQKDHEELRKENTVSSDPPVFTIKRSLTFPFFPRSLMKPEETDRNITVLPNAHNNLPRFPGKGKEGPSVRAKNSKRKQPSLSKQGYLESHEQSANLKQSSNFECLTHSAIRCDSNYINGDIKTYQQPHLCIKSADIMTHENQQSLVACANPKERNGSHGRCTAEVTPESPQRKSNSEGHGPSNGPECRQLQNDPRRLTSSSVLRSSNTNIARVLEKFTLNRSGSLVAPRWGHSQTNNTLAGSKKTRNTLMILTLYCCFFTLPYVGYGFYVATVAERDKFAATRLGMILSSFLLFNAILNPFFYAWRFVEWRQLCISLKSKLTRILDR